MLTVLTNLRQGSKTETLLTGLTRSINLLSATEADSLSSKYKRLLRCLNDNILKCKNHLKFDPNDQIETTYVPFLEEELVRAEEVLDVKDEECDRLDAL